MWDKSGLYGGQSNGSMLLFVRKSRHTLATCAVHSPVVKSTDVAPREGLQRGGGSHPFTLLLSYCPPQQSTVIFPVCNASQDDIGATPKPIPFVNASVSEAFPSTSEYTTSTVRAKKSEARLVHKKDSTALLDLDCLGAWAVNHSI